MRTHPAKTSEDKHKINFSHAPYLWVGNFVLFFGIVLVALHWGDWRVLLKLMTRIDPRWLGAAILFQLGTYACVTVIWKVVLKSCGISIPARSLFALSLAKLFSDQMVPSYGISGSVVAMRGFIRRKSSAGAAAAAVILNTTSRYLPYFLLFTAALAIVWKHHMMNRGLLYLALFFTLILLLLTLAVPGVIWMTRRGKIPAYFRRMPRLATFFKTIHEIPKNVFRNAPLWILAFAANGTIFILDSATLWVLVCSLGTPVHLPHAFAAFIISSVVTDLAIVPGKIGVFEGSVIALLRLFSLPIEQAIAAIVLFRGLTYWLPMIPGFIITKREFRKLKPSVLDSVTIPHRLQKRT